MRFSRFPLLALLFLAGCGGSSSSSGGSFNLFTGTWTGPWTAGSDKGTATLHFTGLNSVAGTIDDTTTGQVYVVSGSVETPGLNSTTLNLSETNQGNTVSFTGTITESLQQSVKSLNGTLTDTDNHGTTQTITLSYLSS